ncbi:MAG: hypothetical protein ACFFCZ_14870 [Promethearchaeota archaeon]
MIVIPRHKFLGIHVLVLLLVVILMFQPTVFTLTQAPIWSQTYGGNGSDATEALIQTTDGGYALAGWTTSYSAEVFDFWLVKTDSNGLSQWDRTYGGKGAEVAEALIQTTDGGYALAGWTNSYGAGYSETQVYKKYGDFWLVKTDSNGLSQWNQTYGGVEDDYAEALIQTTDGGYALAGRTATYGAGDYDFWLVKTDSNGLSQWNQTYGGVADDAAEALIQTTDGGYALAGWTNSYGAGYSETQVYKKYGDFWLVKTDSNGLSQWNQTYGGVEDDYAEALIQTTDGGYALAGRTATYGAGDYDFWLVKTDSNGLSQWNQTYGGVADDAAEALIQTTDGGYALAGWTNSYGAGYSETQVYKKYGDFWLVKTDSNGLSQWNQTYGGVEDDYAEALIQTTDGGYALAGWTGSYGGGFYDSWLVKTEETTFQISGFDYLTTIVIGGVGLLAAGLVHRRHKKLRQKR